MSLHDDVNDHLLDALARVREAISAHRTSASTVLDMRSVWLRAYAFRGSVEHTRGLIRQARKALDKAELDLDQMEGEYKAPALCPTCHLAPHLGDCQEPFDPAVHTHAHAQGRMCGRRSLARCPTKHGGQGQPLEWFIFIPGSRMYVCPTCAADLKAEWEAR